ncbi:hypothetical protein RND81_04G204900 [Saponaria officinalis]|uniref:AB hydrolase-1 domain-containing protein n=1 Tax=Saponaria officinalis TaxID=3572 RepID=A0AAW1LR14_SAPOF
MAIISDYDDQDQPTSPSKSKPKPKPKPESKPGSKPSINQNPFTFWFYLTIIVSIITFLFILVSNLSTPDPKTWFLNLPANLRAHFGSGRILKVQVTQNQPQVEVFTYSQGDKSSENVLIIHGLGCSSFSFKGIVDGLASKGLFGVAIDLPGSGFSEKAVQRVVEGDLGENGGVLARVLGVYEEIKEKGIFWGFDSLIEHGHLPYNELNNPENRVSKEKKVMVALELGVDEVGRVLDQIVEAMGLPPFHLVLHDSALVMCANWVVKNAMLVRSVTLMDSLPREMALPLLPFEVPVLRDVILRVDYLFGRLIASCCSRGVGGSSVEAHRVLLEGRNGRGAVLGTGKRLNQSFDLGEWVGMDGMKGMPMLVLWSGSWSEEWTEKGKQVAEIVSRGKLTSHSGGRWPQEDTSGEVAENIFSFVASLPKTQRKADDEPVSEHIKKTPDEANVGDLTHHDEHGHDHGAYPGYTDAYGLGQGQGDGHGWEL